MKIIKIMLLILQGLTYKTANEYLHILKKYKNLKKKRHSVKKIMSILPINTTFDKLLEDRLSLRLLMDEHLENLPEYYFMILIRDGKKIIYDFKSGNCFNDIKKIVALLREKKSLEIVPSHFLDKREKYICEYLSGNILVNDELLNERMFIEILQKIGDDYLILESIKGEKVNVITINADGHIQYVCKENCKLSISAKTVAIMIAKAFPEIEYINFRFCMWKSCFVIDHIEMGTDLIHINQLKKEQVKYIKKKLDSKKLIEKNKNTIIRKYVYSYIAQKKGFLDYMYRNWNRGKKEDWKSRSVSFNKVIWAHKRGFYSYRIFQYGLTEENYKDFLSDYQYKRLRPINNVYEKWLRNKLSFYYTLNRYINYLPLYYFHIFVKDGKINFLRKGGCKDNFEESAYGIISLLEEKKKLVFKPVVASHGDGFYKVEYNNNKYFVNDSEVSNTKLEDFINSINKYYLVTEYVEMHKDLKNIYANVTGTIRVMVINRNCNNPQIEDAYLRLGTSKTGQTDNITSGGIFAHIDKESGKFGNAQIIKDHLLKKCEFHPDTDVKIEGTIPFWRETCEKIIEISKYIFPLEYMGFDIVITESGFKLLEINTHQELHRYPEYSNDVKEFFKKKCISQQKQSNSSPIQ